MDRLTSYEGSYCFMTCAGEHEPYGKECNMYNVCYERKMYEKLRDYEELDETGRLVELPCNCGSTVYIKTRYSKIQPYEIIECKVRNMSFYEDGKSVRFSCRGRYKNGNNYQGTFKNSSMGKTVFLTLEEAEVALENMEE